MKELGGRHVRAADDEEKPGPIISLPGHVGAVTCIAFSPDGQRAATHGGLGDHRFHLWDIRGRKQAGGESIPECEGLAVLWTAGGKIVSGGAGGPEGGAVVLQLPEKKGELKGTPLSHNGPVRSIALSPDGKRLASADGVSKVFIWDFTDGKLGAKLREFDNGRVVHRMAFSPDGSYLVAGCDDNVARLWNIKEDRQERAFEGHTAPVGCVAFSADGRRVYSATLAPLGTTDNTIRVWNAQTGEEIDKLVVGTEGQLLSAAAFSPDGRRALTGHSNGEVRLWDLGEKKKITDFSSHKHLVQSLAFSPDGRLALSGEDWQGGSLMWLYRLPLPSR